MQTSPILKKETARQIFQNPDLESIFLSLEDPKKIIDNSEILAKLVNTNLSRSEPFSRWVRYREGYSPVIVHKILEMFPIALEDEYVLDPMCGSGSTQVAAQQLGILSAGSDVSPYAVLVSQVKTRGLSDSDVHDVNDFMRKIDISKFSGPEKFSATETYLLQYFPKKNFKALISLKREIRSKFPNVNHARNFLEVAFLAIVEASSNRKKDGNGLASRPSSVDDVALLFQEQVDLMLKDILSTQWLCTPSFTIERSALQIDSAISEASQTHGKTLGAVIFSPPYANSFDYYESYKLELLMGDFYTIESIGEERKKLIRSYRQMGKSQKVPSLQTVEKLIEVIMDRLPAKEEKSGVRDGRSRLLPNLLRGYFEDMQEFLIRAAAAMPPGSYMAIVVDQSAYLGVLVPTDLLLAEIAMQVGFQFENLVICRKAKTSGQQLNMQPALSEVLRESAVILRR